MIEILPIKILRDEDAPIFGGLNVALAKLGRHDLSIGQGIVATAPNLKLKTTLEHFDFGQREVFEQSLVLVKKELQKLDLPEILSDELSDHQKFLVGEEVLTSKKAVWLALLDIWLEQVKQRLWKDGFRPGLTEDLTPQLVIFINKPEAFGNTFYDPLQDDVIINIKKGRLEPANLKKLSELVELANKRLLIPNQYEWILDGSIKLVKVKPYTPSIILEPSSIISNYSERSQDGDFSSQTRNDNGRQSVVKVFLDLSTGLTIEKTVDGIYINSEKIYDLNKPQASWEELVYKLVEAVKTFPDSPVLMKLADMSEGMGKIRGTLRLLHQDSLLEPLIEAFQFVRNKHDGGHQNIHLVIPFVRGVNELMEIKRKLATSKILRKNSMQIWLEVATPENLINLEEYLITGIDGVVVNLDELMAYLNGFDHTQADLTFYKAEVSGLIKFMEDGLKLLHKSKIPFIAFGSVSLNPQVLDFLVEKGAYGVVADKYEAPSMSDLLHQAEKRMILRKSA